MYGYWSKQTKTLFDVFIFNGNHNTDARNVKHLGENTVKTNMNIISAFIFRGNHNANTRNMQNLGVDSG